MKDRLFIVPYQPVIHNLYSIFEVLSLSVYNPTQVKLKSLLESYQNGSHSLVLAVHNKGILGCLGYRITKDTCIILHLAVLATHRRKGIATAMIEWVEAHCACSLIEAQTDDEGLAFYLACGFTSQCLGELYPNTVRYRCFKAMNSN